MEARALLEDLPDFRREFLLQLNAAIEFLPHVPLELVPNVLTKVGALVGVAELAVDDGRDIILGASPRCVDLAHDVVLLDLLVLLRVVRTRPEEQGSDRDLLPVVAEGERVPLGHAVAQVKLVRAPTELLELIIEIGVNVLEALSDRNPVLAREGVIANHTLPVRALLAEVCNVITNMLALLGSQVA